MNHLTEIFRQDASRRGLTWSSVLLGISMGLLFGCGDGGDPCEGVTCGGAGVCVVVGGDPTCACDPGFRPEGPNCLPAGSGTDGGMSNMDGGGGSGSDGGGGGGSDAGGGGGSDAGGGGGGSDAGGGGGSDGGGSTADGSMPPPTETCDAPWCTGTTAPPAEATCVDDVEPFYPSPAHTGGDEARFERDDPLGGEPMVFDRYTGAVWTACPLGRTGRTCGIGTVTPLSSWAALDGACRTLRWGGHDDWVAPPGPIVESLVDLTRRDRILHFSPLVENELPRSSFLIAVPSGSSQTRADRTGDFRGNSGAHGYCVRSGDGEPLDRTVRRCASSTVGERAEPTLTDLETGIVWQACPAGLTGADCTSGAQLSSTFDEARQFCEDLTWAGFDDWQLPSAEQVRSMLGRGSDGLYLPVGIPAGFVGSVANTWTSTFEPERGFQSVLLWGQNSVLAYRRPLLRGSRSQFRCVRAGGPFEDTVTDDLERHCTETTQLRAWEDYPTDGAPRFVRTDETGGEPVVSDALLEAEWVGCAVGLTGPDCASGTVTGRPFPETRCSSLRWGGHDDWRMPRTDELMSLHTYAPMADDGASTYGSDVREHFPALPETLNSEPIPRSRAYPGLFQNGAWDNTTNGSALCIRDADSATPDRRERCADTTFWTRAQPTVSYADVGLMWVACPNGQSGRRCEIGEPRTFLSVSDVTAFCEDLEWAGHTDWRAATFRESATLIDYTTDREDVVDPYLFGWFAASFIWQRPTVSEHARSVSRWWGSAATPRSWSVATDRNYVPCVRDL